MKIRKFSAAFAVLTMAAIMLSGCNSDGTENTPVSTVSEDISSDPMYVEYDTPPAPVGGISTILSNVVYPPEARQAGIEGMALVQAYVDEKGKVSKCTPHEQSTADPLLYTAAAAALEKTVFTPAEKDEKAVGVWITVPVVFKLDDSEKAE